MAIGDPSLKFRIDADAGPAKREIDSLYGKLGGVGGGFASAFGGALPMIGAVTAALGAGAVALFNFTKNAAEVGSTLYDASIQTGLSAEAISALKLAADSSGSSLENISGSVSKFNVLLGQAAQGNEKAQKTLDAYGITAKTTDDALNQAIATIGNMTTADQKAAAAKDLFKDKTGAILPVIDQVGGKFDEFIAKAKKLGLTLTEEDLRAADDFGDTLEVLGAQAQIAGVKFATQFMPNVTRAMNTISGVMGNNQDVSRAWGRAVGDVIRGVELSFIGLGKAGQFQFDLLNAAFGTNLRVVVDWAHIVSVSIGPIISLLYLLGKAMPNFKDRATMGGDEYELDSKTFTMKRVEKPKPPALPNLGAVGGGAGKGGGASSAKDDAERRRREAVQAAEREMRDVLGVYKAGYAERKALLDAALAREEISEKEHIRDVARLRLEDLMDQKRLNEGLLANQKINLSETERADILQRIKVLTIEIRVAKLEGSTAITQKIKEEVAEENRLLEVERQRLAAIKKRREEARLDALYERKRREEAEMRERTARGVGILGESPIVKRDEFGRFKEFISPVQTLAEMGGQAMQQLASGIGSVVEQFVLMGTAGPDAMRKLVASILAGVAAQAATLAIMELAYGIAALTHWGRIIYGRPEPHFKAAALFASVAAGAGIAGRALAGDLFNGKGAGAGGGSTAAAGQSTPSPISRQTSNAFISGTQSQQSQQQAQEIRRLAATVDRLNQQLDRMQAMPAGEVLQIGISQRKGLIGQTIVGEARSNPRISRDFLKSAGVK